MQFDPHFAQLARQTLLKRGKPVAGLSEGGLGQTRLASAVARTAGPLAIRCEAAMCRAPPRKGRIRAGAALHLAASDRLT